MNKLEPCVLSFKFVGRREVDKISVHDVGRPELVFSIPIRFTRASFARQWHLLIRCMTWLAPYMAAGVLKSIAKKLAIIRSYSVCNHTAAVTVLELNTEISSDFRVAL